MENTLSPTRPLWAELVIESPCPFVCLCVCVSAPSVAVFFEASDWPCDHMISSRPLIGQPPPHKKNLNKKSLPQPFFILFFFILNHAT